MDPLTFTALAALIGGIVAGIFLWRLSKQAQPEGDWWDEIDTTIEHRTRMFQGRDVSEIGRNPDAET